MDNNILTNNNQRNLKQLLTEIDAKVYTNIKIASAFFSDTEFITNWIDNSKQIDLLVSLRPPTNYYSLKKVQPKLGIDIRFLGEEFHSKFYIFYKEITPIFCIIGSSNFTSGGLHKNIETNAVFTDKRLLKEICRQFNELWQQSYLLQPSDLDSFKIRFDNFRKRDEQNEKEQNELQKSILTNKRTDYQKKIKVSKEAKQYYNFWRVVDEVKDIVGEISNREYPNVPVYISIDHFWHWVKTIWSKENRIQPTAANRHQEIAKLFQEYCNWDKINDNHTNEMAKTSKIFAEFLSLDNIDYLTEENAKKIYGKLHSGAMRTRRFSADETFVKDNSIKKIKESLKYLLYSNNEIDLRIHNLCKNPKYKLNQLDYSGTQEIIGWVNPEKYPIRNNKADEALSLLGFEIK